MLLFDQNLSQRLVTDLSDCYPNSTHVREFGFEARPDTDVWVYAKRSGHAIVTKDSDFRQWSFLYGAPPKVIWIGLGNCSTRRIEELLREHRSEILAFLSDPSKAFLAFA